MTQIPVVHSMFETAALARIIGQRYAIGRIAAVELYRSYVSDVYRVETGQGATYFLKIARRSWRTLEHVAWEVALQQHLRRHRVAVSRPIPQRDGETVCVLDAPEGARAAVLYAEMPEPSRRRRLRHGFTRQSARRPAGCTPHSITSTCRLPDRAEAFPG